MKIMYIIYIIWLSMIKFIIYCVFLFLWQPAKWAFTSHTVLKNSEQAPR